MSAAAMQALSEQLGEEFLGTRVDRGETTGWVKLSSWREAGRLMKEFHGFTTLSDLTAIDYLDRDPRFDLSVVLLHPTTLEQVRLKTMLGESDTAASWVPLWSGANWYEREVFDLFGIRFADHPNLVRILLPADYQGYPLRKDYPVTGPPASVYR